MRMFSVTYTVSCCVPAQGQRRKGPAIGCSFVEVETHSHLYLGVGESDGKAGATEPATRPQTTGEYSHSKSHMSIDQLPRLYKRGRDFVYPLT